MFLNDHLTSVAAAGLLRCDQYYVCRAIVTMEPVFRFAVTTPSGGGVDSRPLPARDHLLHIAA